MADRFWVGGSGTWSTSTTNWASSSGGASGATAPTSADTVYFDANSNVGTGAFTVTLSGALSCLNFTIITGALALDGVMTLAGTGTVSVSGSMTLVSTNLTLTNTGTFTFTSTTTGKTITTAGQTLPFSVTFNGVAGAWTLQDALTMESTRTLTLTNGTLNVNNLTLTTGFLASSGSTSTRVLAFGTGKIVCTGVSGTVYYMEAGSGATAFSYTGTSDIEITNASGANRTITFQGTWTESTALNVAITTGSDIVTLLTSVLNLDFTGFTGTWTGASAIIYGSLTLNSGMSTTASASTIILAAGSGSKTITTAGVTINFPIQVGPNTPQSTANWQLQDAITLGSTRTLTIYNGTFTTNSNTVTCGIFSCAIGNNYTRTVATGTSNINLTGVATTILNLYYTGVTYTGSMNFYFTTNSSTGTREMTTSGGAETTAPNIYVTAGTDTVNVSGVIRNLDCTGFGTGGTGTLGLGGATTNYGGLVLNSNISTASSASIMTFAATSGTDNITTAGVTINFQMTFNGVGGTWQLQDALTLLSSRTLALTNGTLNLNNNSLTAGIVSLTGTATRVLTIGTGSITVTGNAATVWNSSDLTGLTVTGNQAVTFTYNGSTGTRVLNSGVTSGTEANSFSFIFTGNASDTIQMASTKVKNLDFTGFGAGFVTNNAFTIYGNLLVSPTMTFTAGNAALTFAATSGIQQIFSAGNTIDRPFTVNGVGGTFQLGENLTLGTTNGTLTLTNGTVDLNSKVLSVPIFSSTNSNARTLAFGTGTINITGFNATIWDTTNLTNFTTTGTQTINCTSTAGTAIQTRTISAGSTGATESNVFSFNITAGTDVIVTTTGHSFKNLNFTGFSGTLNNTTRTIYGDLTLSSTMTCAAGSNASTFAATSGTKLITTNGITTDFPFTFNGAGGTWQLVGNLTMATVTYTFTITTGTFNANGYNVTIGLFSSANSNTRALNLGSGTWNILGSGATAWNLGTTTGMTLTPGTATINMSSASAKTFVGGGLTYPILNQGGAGTLTITGSNTFNTIKNTTQPATVSFTAATTTTVTNFMLSGIPGSLITIGTSTSTTHTISVPVGTVTANYCTISYSIATGGATFRAPTSNGSVNGLNNSGWVFTALGNPVGTMLSFFS